VGAQEARDLLRQAAQALAKEALGPRRRGGMAVAEPRVQPLAGLRQEGKQRMPGHLARIGAARAVARSRRPMVLDEGGVEVKRDLFADLQGVDTREQPLKRAIELPEVPEAEAAQEAPQRRRLGQAVAAERRLGLIGAQHLDVVQALTARDQRLA